MAALRLRGGLVSHPPGASRAWTPWPIIYTSCSSKPATAGAVRRDPPSSPALATGGVSAGPSAGSERGPRGDLRDRGLPGLLEACMHGLADPRAQGRGLPAAAGG